MSSSDKQLILSKFMLITQLDENRAKFYLECSAWQLEVALASFFEEAENATDDVTISAPVENPPLTPRPKSTAGATVTTATTAPAASTIGATAAATTSRLRQPSRYNFATMSDLSFDRSREVGEAFYAGGSGSSGQQILGPPNGPRRAYTTSEIYKIMQRHLKKQTASRNPEANNQQFRGTGYKLGESSSGPSDVVPPKPAKPPTQPSQFNVVLKLWRQGFTVNDQEMRTYNDPANKEFIDKIKRGECPPELIRDAVNSNMHLVVEDHRHEDVSSAQTIFGGTGYILGSTASVPVAFPDGDQKMVETEKTEDSKTEANKNEAKKNLNLDKEKPLTKIQIRLTDGSRLIGEFNLSHTIGDVRHYITTARPQYGNADFLLITSSLPNRELSDDSETIDKAGLLNAAIMLRFK